MKKPTILKNKIVGEFASKPGKKDTSKVFEDKICYLYLETDRKLSLTVSGQVWSLLLPLAALRAFVNRAYHEVGKVEKREVRTLKTKHTIGKPLPRPEPRRPRRPTKKGQ